ASLTKNLSDNHPITTEYFKKQELPLIHEFHSILGGKISQEDYNNAQNDAILKITKVKIELFTEMAMHDFIEKAKHDGIAIAVHRYFKANNPNIGNAFDISQLTIWIS
ncbi:4965_t:CDS:2, partial [Funneliformis geosporum]